jgi:hypothetical protein
MPQATHCRHCRNPLATGIERVYGEHVGCDRPPAERETKAVTVAAVVLDWSGKDGGPRAGVGDLKPCVACGGKTMLRHPDTGLPHHKTCAEKALNR